MERNRKLGDIARAIEVLFKAKFGVLKKEDLQEVFRILEASLGEKKPQDLSSPKMQGEKHLSDIIGTNIHHALEAYEWEDAYPVSENGVTVSDIKSR